MALEIELDNEAEWFFDRSVPAIDRTDAHEDHKLCLICRIPRFGNLVTLFRLVDLHNQAGKYRVRIEDGQYPRAVTSFPADCETEETLDRHQKTTNRF